MTKNVLIVIFAIAIPTLLVLYRHIRFKRIASKTKLPRIHFFFYIGMKIFILIYGINLLWRSHFTNLWSILLIVYASCASIFLVYIFRRGTREIKSIPDNSQ